MLLLLAPCSFVFLSTQIWFFWTCNCPPRPAISSFQPFPRVSEAAGRCWRRPRSGHCPDWQYLLKLHHPFALPTAFCFRAAAAAGLQLQHHYQPESSSGSVPPLVGFYLEIRRDQACCSVAQTRCAVGGAPPLPRIGFHGPDRRQSPLHFACGACSATLWLCSSRTTKVFYHLLRTIVINESTSRSYSWWKSWILSLTGRGARNRWRLTKSAQLRASLCICGSPFSCRGCAISSPVLATPAPGASDTRSLASSLPRTRKDRRGKSTCKTPVVARARLFFGSFSGPIMIRIRMMIYLYL